MESRKILQVIPADGWWIVFDDHDSSPTHRRVVCWALVEKEDVSTEVIGLYVDGDEIGLADEITASFEYQYDPTRLT